MKVLWFTNSPSLANKKLGYSSYGGGWMESLQEEFEKKEDIQMAVSFYLPKQHSKFEFNGTLYYPLMHEVGSNPIVRWMDRMTHKYEPVDISIQKYKEVVNDFKPDVIHVWGSEEAFGLVAKVTDVPVVLWIQGNITVYNTKWYTGLTPKQLLKHSSLKNRLTGKGILHRCHKLKKIEGREKEVFKTVKNFIGRTNWDKRITRYLADEHQYFHCEEMLRRDFFNVHWELQNSNQFSILSVLSPQTYKGFETIIETMGLLNNKIAAKKVVWRIAGSASNSEVVSIFEKSFGADFNQLNIEFLGGQSADKLIELMLKSDLFVHPSHIENSPNSVCEAMLVGMPIIAGFSGGVSSLLEDGKEGILFQTGEHYSLAGAILQMMDEPQLAKDYGNNARERALKRHNVDAIVESVIDVYKKIQ